MFKTRYIIQNKNRSAILVLILLFMMTSTCSIQKIFLGNPHANLENTKQPKVISGPSINFASSLLENCSINTSFLNSKQLKSAKLICSPVFAVNSDNFSVFIPELDNVILLDNYSALVTSGTPLFLKNRSLLI